MKKLLLLLAVVAMVLPGCKKINEELDVLGARLDKLEQSVPTIEEQIESINAQLVSLREISSQLGQKDQALERSINNLQSYVDTQIANAKSDAAAAYATIKQYEDIVSQLTALQNSTNKLGEDLTAKIKAEIATLNSKIADLEARLKAVEDKVEDLLARIQSVSYIPAYDDGKAIVVYNKVALDFRISPKDAVAELANIWQSAVSVEAIYTKTRTVEFVEMPIVAFESDTENGVISVTASGENLSAEFFAGEQTASVTLVISDGNNSITSDYVQIEEGATKNNKIYYTTSDGKKLFPNTNASLYGARLISNIYKDGQGILTFDDTVISIGNQAFINCSSLTSVTIPDSVTSIEDEAFKYCSSLTSITIPDSVIWIEDYAFSCCRSLTSVTIPDSVTWIGYSAFDDCSSLTSVTIGNGVTLISDSAFDDCSSLTSVYCKPATPPTGYSGMFDRNASGRKIYVPRNSLEAYKSAEGWKNYANYIEWYFF